MASAEIDRIIGTRRKGIDGDKLCGIADQPGQWVLNGKNSYYKAEDADVFLNFINYDSLWWRER